MISARRIALTAILFSACNTVPQFAPVKAQQSFPERTAPEQIEVFRSQIPSKGFDEIGSVAVCCQLSDMTLKALKEAAAKHGGDALIGLDVNSQGAVIGTVIRYR